MFTQRRSEGFTLLKFQSAANTATIIIVKFLYSINQRKYGMFLSKQSWDKKLGIHEKQDYIGYLVVIWMVPNTN